MAPGYRKGAQENAHNIGGGTVNRACDAFPAVTDASAASRADAAPAGDAAAPPAIAAPTVSVIRCANGVVLQPVKGNVIPYTEIPDDTFASGLLGEGVGVQPTDEWVVAPFDGEICFVAESKYAVSVTANDMELLIHVGVDTVNMNGDGFTCLVQTGDQVKAGQPLIRFDRARIKAAGYSDTVAVLLTNAHDLEGVEIGVKES